MDDDNLINDIGDEVMRCLVAASFFGQLDDLLCSTDGERAVETCRRDFALTESILRRSGFDSDDAVDVCAGLHQHES
jgi:hypothetical protein